MQSRVDALLTGSLSDEVVNDIAPEVVEIEETTHEEPIAETEEESGTDDYGVEIAKGDDNSIIRERLARQAESMTRKHRQEIEELERRLEEKSYQSPTPASSETSDDWEVQLNQYIERSVESKLTRHEQEAATRQARQHEQELQSKFEVKFNEGVARYQDFESVVLGTPLTQQMVMATRGMSDPAAFIYAAAKNQSSELDRISKIYDPMTQAVELGKLEERMRKAKSVSSNTAKPIGTPKGDVSDKHVKTWNIDDKLRHDEDQIRKNRMR